MPSALETCGASSKPYPTQRFVEKDFLLWELRQPVGELGVPCSAFTSCVDKGTLFHLLEPGFRDL